MFNNKAKRILSLAVAGITVLSLVGCKSEKQTADGKIQITVSQWPSKDGDPIKYESRMKLKEDFEKKYPDIEIIPDEWGFELQTFNAKAEGNTLPTIYQPFLTEAKRIMENHYSYDVTDLLKKYNYYDKITDFFMESISENGRIYHIPGGIYSLGLAMNYDLLEEAGLANGDGSVKIPETFDELRTMSKTIKDKTGKAGFVFPSTQNIGGWIFNVLAWNYGANFMERDSSGKWKANLDSSEVADALKFLHDMKWEDNSLPENTLINSENCTSLLGSGQAAMSLINVYQAAELPRAYDISKDSVIFAKVPAGPKAHYTLMGGGTYAIAPNATEEQADAAIKWLEFTNILPVELSEESIAKDRQKYEEQVANGKEIVGLHSLSAWNSDYYYEQNGHYLIDEYINVDPSHLASYNDPSGIDYHVEEPVCTQELYSILDKCIQEVLTNKNADIKQILKDAQSQFQSNYLDYAD